MFNNETGYHEPDDWAFDPNTLWLIEDRAHQGIRRFYIIPTNDYTCEIEGEPDDEVLDRLNAFCRSHPETGQPTQEEYWSLGLISVPQKFWRFSAVDGYYNEYRLFMNYEYL